MSGDKFRFSKALRTSGVLLLAGLCVEAVSLHWIHPLAFMGFVIVGGALLAAGVLLFLYSLVSFAPVPGPHDPGAD